MKNVVSEDFAASTAWVTDPNSASELACPKASEDRADNVVYCPSPRPAVCRARRKWLLLKASMRRP